VAIILAVDRMEFIQERRRPDDRTDFQTLLERALSRRSMD